LSGGKLDFFPLPVVLAVGFSPSRAHTKDDQLKERLNGLSGDGRNGSMWLLSASRCLALGFNNIAVI
jgi:hypothetical protein